MEKGFSDRTRRWRFPVLVILAGLGISVCTQAAEMETDPLVTAFEHRLEEAGFNTYRIGPSQFSDIVKWSVREDRLPHCIYWLEFLYRQHPENLVIEMALADSYFLGAEWELLLDHIDESHWVQQEHIRHYYGAFAKRQLRRPDWKESWQQAIEAAQGNSKKVESLILLLAEWKHWARELENLLWMQLEERNALATLATNSLIKLYSMQNNLSGLIRVNDTLLDWDPENLEMLNNKVLFRTFQAKTSEINPTDIEALRIAAQEEEKYALTLAVFYSATGEQEKAQDWLEQLKDEQKLDANKAGYVAYVVRETHPEKAREYYDLAKDGDYYDFEKLFLRFPDFEQ